MLQEERKKKDLMAQGVISGDMRGVHVQRYFEFACGHPWRGKYHSRQSANYYNTGKSTITVILTPVEV